MKVLIFTLVFLLYGCIEETTDENWLEENNKRFSGAGGIYGESR
jgi:hypothetical protein